MRIPSRVTGVIGRARAWASRRWKWIAAAIVGLFAIGFVWRRRNGAVDRGIVSASLRESIRSEEAWVNVYNEAARRLDKENTTLAQIAAKRAERVASMKRQVMALERGNIKTWEAMSDEEVDEVFKKAGL